MTVKSLEGCGYMEGLKVWFLGGCHMGEPQGNGKM